MDGGLLDDRGRADDGPELSGARRRARSTVRAWLMTRSDRTAAHPTSPDCARCSSTARSRSRRRCPTPRRWSMHRRRSCRSTASTTEVVRLVDHDVATGVWPDMTEHGWEVDEWPAVQERVWAADILVIAGPIWLGDNSSVTKRCIERLYASSSDLNDNGQWRYYGRVGGCLITGNEDGIKHCAIERPLQPPAHRLRHPAPGRRRLDRRSRTGTVLPRPGIGRTGERVHRPQHHLHDLEPHAPGLDAARSPAASRRTATSARAWDDGQRFDWENPEYRRA